MTSKGKKTEIVDDTHMSSGGNTGNSGNSGNSGNNNTTNNNQIDVTDIDDLIYGATGTVVKKSKISVDHYMDWAKVEIVSVTKALVSECEKKYPDDGVMDALMLQITNIRRLTLGPGPIMIAYDNITQKNYLGKSLINMINYVLRKTGRVGINIDTLTGMKALQLLIDGLAEISNMRKIVLT